METRTESRGNGMRERGKQEILSSGWPPSLDHIIRPASRAARIVAALHDPSVGTRALAAVVPALPDFFFNFFNVEMVDCVLI